MLDLAQRKLSRPIRAFTIVFSDELYNEERLAQQTAMARRHVRAGARQPA